MKHNIRLNQAFNVYEEPCFVCEKSADGLSGFEVVYDENGERKAKWFHRSCIGQILIDLIFSEEANDERSNRIEAAQFGKSFALETMYRIMENNAGSEQMSSEAFWRLSRAHAHVQKSTII